MDILKNSYLGEVLSKKSKLFSQASLVEALMWTKFQIEIRYLDKEGPGAPYPFRLFLAYMCPIYRQKN